LSYITAKKGDYAMNVNLWGFTNLDPKTKH